MSLGPGPLGGTRGPMDGPGWYGDVGIVLHLVHAGGGAVSGQCPTYVGLLTFKCDMVTRPFLKIDIRQSRA